MTFNPVDPKWLELLKASGWQTTALAVAFALFIHFVNTEVIPTTDSPLWITLPSIGLLICSCLALASIGSVTTNYLRPKLERWSARRTFKRMVIEFIPYMTDHDRAIIGYLLYHDQKMFQTEADGGYAAPLIGKGIIRIAGQQGQQIHAQFVPFEVRDEAWEIFLNSRDAFPYEPPRSGQTEVHPWAISWMLR